MPSYPPTWTLLLLFEDGAREEADVEAAGDDEARTVALAQHRAAT
jgi:hypothetical protein